MAPSPHPPPAGALHRQYYRLQLIYDCYKNHVVRACKSLSQCRRFSDRSCNSSGRGRIERVWMTYHRAPSVLFLVLSDLLRHRYPVQCLRLRGINFRSCSGRWTHREQLHMQCTAPEQTHLTRPATEKYHHGGCIVQVSGRYNRVKNGSNYIF